MGEKAPEISSLSFEEALKELEALSQRLSQGESCLLYAYSCLSHPGCHQKIVFFLMFPQIFRITFVNFHPHKPGITVEDILSAQKPVHSLI